MVNLISSLGRGYRKNIYGPNFLIAPKFTCSLISKYFVFFGTQAASDAAMDLEWKGGTMRVLETSASSGKKDP